MTIQRYMYLYNCRISFLNLDHVYTQDLASKGTGGFVNCTRISHVIQLVFVYPLDWVRGIKTWGYHSQNLTRYCTCIRTRSTLESGIDKKMNNLHSNDWHWPLGQCQLLQWTKRQGFLLLLLFLYHDILTYCKMYLTLRSCLQLLCSLIFYFDWSGCFLSDTSSPHISYTSKHQLHEQKKSKCLEKLWLLNYSCSFNKYCPFWQIAA